MVHQENKPEVSQTVEKYIGMVYKLALAQTKNTANAEDVTQEVFLRFLQHQDKLKSEEHTKAWLIRVTVNCSKSLFMSSWFRRTAPLEEDIPFDTPEKGEVYYAVMDLPQKYRAVVHLFYYEEMSVREIAETLGEKETTVKSQLHRAREMLKKMLKGGYDFV